MDIKYRIKQLKIIHWVAIAVLAINIAVPLLIQSESAITAEYPKIIYPPNIVSIVLINSDEYRALVASEIVKDIDRCYVLGPFVKKNDLDTATMSLEAKEFGVDIKTNPVKEVTGYWVYLEPERSRALARLKVEEIKLKGLMDVVLLTKNEPQYAISLGFFKEKTFAVRRMLKAQSLSLNAKMEVRFKNQEYQWLKLQIKRKRDFSGDEWLTFLHDYEDVELKIVDCE